MAAIYLCDVTGDGQSTTTAYRPNLPAGTVFACLMIHEAKAKALILSTADTITHPGVTRLIQASSVDALRTLAATTSPTTAQRTAINTWLTANTYATVASGTWLETIHAIARQVNPTADLNLTAVY